MIRPLPALFAVGLFVSGCGGDDSAESVDDATTTTADSVIDPLAETPTCEEWTERDVTSDEVESGCRDVDFIAGTATYDCDDGRVLYWNDRVWGYVGEPAHAYQAEAEQVAPDAEREACGV